MFVHGKGAVWGKMTRLGVSVSAAVRCGLIAPWRTAGAVLCFVQSGAAVYYFVVWIFSRTFAR